MSASTQQGQYLPPGLSGGVNENTRHGAHLVDIRPHPVSHVLSVCQPTAVRLTSFDAASAGLPQINAPEGSVFFAYQYLLPFEQKHESQ